MSAPDWSVFHRRHWDQRPARIAADPPAPLGDLYAVAVAACGPFRAGTRFRALPDVRFRTHNGLLRAPGDLLPGPADTTAAAYRGRLRNELTAGWLLSVRQPLHLDYPLWDRVRRAVEGLWRVTGRPVLPVSAELTFGERLRARDGLGGPSLHAHLVWVLQGELRVHLWPEAAGPPPEALAEPGCEVAGARTLTAAAGELAYWPAGHRAAVHHGEQCVTLHLSVPADSRLLAGEARNLLPDAVQARPERDGTVPYLPFPPPVAEDGSVPPIPCLQSAEDAARRTAGDSQFLRSLRVREAAWASAAGLEPSPAPRTGAAEVVAEGHHLRVRARVLRVPDGSRGSVWACNGHAFAVSGEVADRVLDRLRPGADICVDRLTRDVGGERSRAGVFALLRKLYALRAVEAPDEEQREGAAECRH